MRGLRHPYTWGREHPWVVDGLIALVVTGLGVLSELAPEPGYDRYFKDATAVSIAVNVAATVPLVVRRRHPVPVYANTVVATVVLGIAGYAGSGPWFGLLFGLYAVAAYSSRRWAVGCLVVALAIAVVWVFVVPYTMDPPEVAATFALPAAAWVLGDNIRIRRAYIGAVEGRAAHLEREQDALARQAVMEERGRIARELHDIVAHSMSVMVVQAGAARRTLDRDREQAVQAIGHIEATGRSALQEMRRLVGVLRNGDHDDDQRGRQLMPQPGIAQIPDLVARCRAAGLDVAFSTEGTERPLPDGLELVVYRVVQEALTNTMKHAGPAAHARASLTFEDEALSVVVADDGRGAAAGVPSPNGTDAGRHGLAGMVERVSLYNGEMSWGPRRGGGFRVWARLPAEAAE